MAMLERVLARAGVYSALARVMGATRGRRVYIDRYIRPRPGDRVLDIGCGPADILDALPPVSYCGIDISAAYIDAARRRFGTRGEFNVENLSEATASKYAGFDLVLATGVVHHLDDEEAIALFRLARAALKHDGALVTLDGCFVEGQSRIVNSLLRHDRGRFVRRPGEYLALARTVFPQVESDISRELLRIPYTHLIMRCLKRPDA